MNIHLCKGDETLDQALEYINEHDSEGRKYTFDKDADRCYIGDEAFVSAPVLINYKNTYYALHEV
ncbi:hypothetical protein SAMN02910276_02775 [Butyrivibrio sp. Su6]|uniref:hypothetical protein n=1 Tax=Butyrivibrio sp. Su6 TaxID=1520810 RepID=UPI00089F5F92|nr:hypothetical protein [Butyrivibrio sp. Su6]SEG38872.1 hypothetical protein SAMN02910276_02775 [Butyrivibrio sp. Su6]